MGAADTKRTTLGVIAIIATILAWSGFALGIRGILSSSLALADVAILRFLIPVVLFSRFIPRT